MQIETLAVALFLVACGSQAAAQERTLKRSEFPNGRDAWAAVAV